VRRLSLSHRSAFTLLEVVLIVIIIGMMLAMIIAYFMAPKDKGPLPPIEDRKSMPLIRTPSPAIPAPAATPGPAAVPVPGATPAPAKPIDISPGAVPTFR
jgi:hypothetical protein